MQYVWDNIGIVYVYTKILERLILSDIINRFVFDRRAN